MAFEYHEHTADTAYDNPPQLKMKDSSTFIQIGDIYSMPPPVGFTTTTIDMTHLGTPKGTREFAGGRPDPVQLSITLGYALDSPGFRALQAAKGQIKEFEISYGGLSLVHTFSAIVMSFDPAAITEGGRYEGTLTLQLTGNVSEE